MVFCPKQTFLKITTHGGNVMWVASPCPCLCQPHQLGSLYYPGAAVTRPAGGQAPPELTPSPPHLIRDYPFLPLEALKLPGASRLALAILLRQTVRRVIKR